MTPVALLASSILQRGPKKLAVGVFKVTPCSPSGGGRFSDNFYLNPKANKPIRNGFCRSRLEYSNAVLVLYSQSCNGNHIRYKRNSLFDILISVSSTALELLRNFRAVRKDAVHILDFLTDHVSEMRNGKVSADPTNSFCSTVDIQSVCDSLITRARWRLISL